MFWPAKIYVFFYRIQRALLCVCVFFMFGQGCVFNWGSSLWFLLFHLQSGWYQNEVKKLWSESSTIIGRPGLHCNVTCGILPVVSVMCACRMIVPVNNDTSGAEQIVECWEKTETMCKCFKHRIRSRSGSNINWQQTSRYRAALSRTFFNQVEGLNCSPSNGHWKYLHNSGLI